MTREDRNKVYQLKEEYYILHSRLINDQLKRCDNKEQKQFLLEIIAETNSPFFRILPRAGEDATIE